MNRNLTHTATGWGGTPNMGKFELDRLFGMALTDARFFQHLREQPHKAVAQFGLTEQEAQAVLDVAPIASSVEDLAVRLDSWIAHTEYERIETRVEGPFIGLSSAAQSYSISNDVLLKMIQEGKIRLSTQDVSRVAVQVLSEEYA
jgi:hypothetical protein